jgi:hypothetical protein
MLSRPWTRTLAAAATLLLAGIESPSRADILFDTVYVPTSSVVSVPTTSYISPSYVIPTAYSTVLPTSTVIGSSVVYPTSTYLETSYTTYRYRPRRFVERTTYLASPTVYSLAPTSYFLSSSYIPTTYVSSSSIVPTSVVFDSAVVATSATLCDPSPSPAPARSTATTRPSGEASVVSKPSNGGDRPPSGSVAPAPVMDPASSDVKPEVLARPAEISPPKPQPPTTAEQPSNFELPQPGSAGNPRAQADEPTRYEARKPTYTGMRAASDARNILRGRVVSRDTGLAQEGVTVIVSNASSNSGFRDRTTMSDADGEFKLTLPDGDWYVKVTMPSGNIYTIGRDYLTASSGRVIDPSGQTVGEYIIKR